jgi:hypothetical protein
MRSANESIIFFARKWKLNKIKLCFPPWANFTNILRAAFASIFLGQISTNLKYTNKLLAKLSFKKAARKMLVKLTPSLLHLEAQ